MATDMNSSLKEARLEIAKFMAQVDELAEAPVEIPDRGPFPIFAVAHMGDGYFELHGMSYGELRGYHDLEVEMHVQRRDLARHYDLIEDLTQKVINHLSSKLKNSEFTKLHHWERIDYSLRSSKWGNVDTLAVFFIFRNVKVSTQVN